MSYLLLFSFLYYLCGCKILFCNGENNILEYDFRTLFNLTGRTSLVNIDDAKQQCQSFNGKLAYISSKVLNDKAVLQLKDILHGPAYYIDLTLQGNGVLIWGDGVPYNRTITPDFAFRNEHSRRPYASVTRLYDTYRLYHETGRELGHAICLIPRRVATRTTTTRAITTTTTTITTTTTKTTTTTTTTTKTITKTTKKTTTTTTTTTRTTTTTITTITTTRKTTTTTTSTRTTRKTIETTARTQNFTNILDKNIFNKEIFPIVLAIAAGVTLFGGLLCYACCSGEIQKIYMSYPQSRYPAYYKPGYSGHGYSRLYNNKHG